jgi:hypothetical protein
VHFLLLHVDELLRVEFAFVDDVEVKYFVAVFECGLESVAAVAMMPNSRTHLALVNFEWHRPAELIESEIFNEFGYVNI